MHYIGIQQNKLRILSEFMQLVLWICSLGALLVGGDK